MQVAHQPVARHLRQDRRRRDAGGHPVALPDGQPGHAEPVDREAVGEHVARPDVAAGPGCAAAPRRWRRACRARSHSRRLDHDDRPGDGSSYDLLRSSASRALAVSSLESASPGTMPRAALGQDRRGGDQRSGAGAAAGLVDAGDRRQPDPAQRTLVAVEARRPCGPCCPWAAVVMGVMVARTSPARSRRRLDDALVGRCLARRDVVENAVRDVQDARRGSSGQMTAIARPVTRFSGTNAPWRRQVSRRVARTRSGGHRARRCVRRAR